jgi:hypothetical protein
MWRGTDIAPGALAVTALAISPNYAADRTIYVATNAGAFVSRDGGETYESWSEGLAEPRMIALTSAPAAGNDDGWIYGVSLGGTIWRRWPR